MTKLAGPFGTMPQEPWHSGKDAKTDRVIQSTVGKCKPKQVIKQPEHGSKKAQKWSSIQTNYDQQLITPRVLQMGVSQ